MTVGILEEDLRNISMEKLSGLIWRRLEGLAASYALGLHALMYIS